MSTQIGKERSPPGRAGRTHRVVLVGGTFGPLHKGHEELFRKALSVGDRVCVGVTNDEMTRNKEYANKIPPLEERIANVRRFFEKMKAASRVKIGRLDGIYGPDALTPEADAIVVTEETAANVEKIDDERKRLGLPPLAIYVVKKKLAEDNKPISSTRIRGGIITREGRLLDTRTSLKANGSGKPQKT
jgi:pantetheine-phosphate adenylyltransferase